MLKRLVVSKIHPRSQAQGKLAPGDRIISCNGVLITSLHDLEVAIEMSPNSAPIEVTIERNGGQFSRTFAKARLGVDFDESSSWRREQAASLGANHSPETRSNTIGSPSNKSKHAQGESSALGSSTSEQNATAHLPARVGTMPTLTHVIALFTGIIGPLIILAVSEDEDVKDHAKEAFNWQMSLLLYVVLSILLIFAVVGIFLIIALVILDIVFSIKAASSASKGRLWHYPMAIGILGRDNRTSRPLVTTLPADNRLHNFETVDSPAVAGERKVQQVHGDIETVDSPPVTGEHKILQVHQNGELLDLQFDVAESNEIFYLSNSLCKSDAVRLKNDLEERYPFVVFSIVHWCNSSDPFEAARIAIRGRAKRSGTQSL